MRRNNVRLMFITCTAGLLAVLGTGAPATADPGHDGKTGPPTTQVTPTGRACAEHSGGKSGTDGAVSCIGVQATLDRVPSVGETATLTYTVRTGVQLTPSDITVELPAQLDWAQAPAGFTAGRTTSVQPERAGTIATAQRKVQLVPGRPVTFTGVVKAVAPGHGQIQVRATSPNGSNVDAGKDDVFLTVADRGGPSQFGSVTTEDDLSVATLTAPKAVAARPAWQDAKTLSAAGNPGLPPVTGKAGGTALACDSHVKGNWGYDDQAGVRHNSMNFQVQVRDLAKGTLSVGLTDSNGNFNLCFDAAVATLLYLTFVAENSQFRVQNGSTVFSWNTVLIQNPAAGSTVDFGKKSPSNPADNRAVHAFDEANDAYLFVPKVAAPWCWDQKDTTCRQVRIDWNRDSAHETEYNTDTNIVYLAADDPNAPIVVAHEIGHAVMDDVYNESFPPHPGCKPHRIDLLTNTGCAWIEGFADWFALSVYHTAVFRWPTGESLNLEDPDWNSNWGQGDATEGRVTGAMLDIADNTNEGLWDRSSETIGNLWYTFVHHVDNDFASFWGDRTGDGFNVADTGALATLFQNTIDYRFREPLTDKVMLLRPKPTPHSFSFSTSTPYWSVVGIIPNTQTDTDLTLYDDRAESIYLGNSLFGGTLTDFVAIDSNLRPYGDYYPKVNLYSGSNGYNVEVVQGGGLTLGNLAPMTVSLPNDFVAVRDTFLVAGAPVTITVAPNTSAQDVDLFLMGSNPNNPATFVQARISALTSSARGGPGVSETLTYTPAFTGWYGVVINQRSALGDVTLTRS